MAARHCAVAWAQGEFGDGPHHHEEAAGGRPLLSFTCAHEALTRYQVSAAEPMCNSVANTSGLEKNATPLGSLEP